MLTELLNFSRLKLNSQTIKDQIMFMVAFQLYIKTASAIMLCANHQLM